MRLHGLTNETEEFVGFNFFFLLSHHPSLKINLGENFFRSRMEFVSSFLSFRHSVASTEACNASLHSPSTWTVKSRVSRIITDRKNISSSFFMILDRCSVTHYFHGTGYKSHMETEALIKRWPFPPNVISLPPGSTGNIGGRKRPWNSFLS